MVSDSVGFRGLENASWWGHGGDVTEASSMDDALSLSGLGWGVKKEPIYVSDGRGGKIAVPGRYGIVRDDLPKHDPSRVLDVVSGGYKPIQNADIWAIGEFLVDQTGLQLISGGEIAGGRQVFMLGALPDTSKVLDDTVGRYLLLTGGHTGGHAVRAQFTPIRFSCSNTLAFALSRGKLIVSISHTPSADERIKEAQRLLVQANEYFEEHRQSMEKLARTRITDKFATAFLTALIPAKSEEKDTKKRIETRERIFELYHGAQADGHMEAVSGTAYGLLNAVGQYVDHERGTTDKALQDEAAFRATRFRQTVLSSGQGSHLKSEALYYLNEALDITNTRPEKTRTEVVDELIGAIDLG